MLKARFMAVVVALGVLAGVPAHASPPAAPFNQCPAIGADASCALLIVFNADGSVTTYDDPSVGPYDGIEDTLVGVQNNSSRTIPSVDVTSNTDAFGFDGDGLCAYGVAGCPFGPTGYEGPNTSFVNISPDLRSATISFPSGLPAGASAYFSLEEHITAGSIVTSLPCANGVTLSDAVVRPASGHVYEDDIDLGLSGTTDTIVRGGPLTVTATTSDPTNTLQVEFSVDGSPAGSPDTTAPYQTTIDPTTLTPGAHTVRAKAVQADDPSCRTVATGDFLLQCFDQTVAIDRPQSGHIYNNDIDLGTTSGDPILLGGPLTFHASPGRPADTATVSFTLDTTSLGSTSAPFQVTSDTTPLSPGPHTITATAVEKNPSCSSTTTVPLFRADPGVKAVAQAVTVMNNIPAEGHVTLGGAKIEGKTATDHIRVTDQPVSQIGATIRTADDAASGDWTSPNLHSESDSIVSDVFLVGGLIQATALHGHASVDLDAGSLATSSSAAGSSVEKLLVNGTPIEVSQPNTKVTLPGGAGYLIAEEVIPATGAAFVEETVNALHVFLNTPSFKGEIILGAAFAGANLQNGATPGPRDSIHEADDAGMFRDAGDTPADADPLAQGLYGGGFTPRDLSDVYSFDAGQGDRILVSLSPATGVGAGVGALPVAPAGPADVLGFATNSVNAIHPSSALKFATLHLFDPTGTERAVVIGSSDLTSLIDFNADIPFVPAGAKGRWLIQVERSQGDPDAFYTLGLSLTPVTLLTDDGPGTGDAPDFCGAARALPDSPTGPQGTITFAGAFRDGDVSDAYSFAAQEGQHVHIVIKGDELAGGGATLTLYAPGCQATPLDVGFIEKQGLEQISGFPADVIIDDVVHAGTYGLVLSREYGGMRYGVGNYYGAVTLRDPIQGH